MTSQGNAPRLAGEATPGELTALAPIERSAARGHDRAAGAKSAAGEPYRPLFVRVCVTNAAVLTITCVITVLVFSPGTVSRSVAFKELAIFVVALAAMLTVNFLLVRRTTAPLERLMGLMRRVDPLRPGQRVAVDGDASEATELADTFNEMLDRLEFEREASARRALAAQESERVRIARELHDEIGQGLTAAILQLGRVKRDAPAALQEQLDAAQDTVRGNLDELRRIAQHLRPGSLDELGLVSALTSFSGQLAEQADLRLQRHLTRELPRLTHEEELVVYRVAQEALTNVARHAEAEQVKLLLNVAPDGRSVSLVVADDGQGLEGDPPPGGGIRGMYERALLADANVTVGPRPGGGTEVRLDLILAEADT